MCRGFTLLGQTDQFVISSDKRAPRKPNTAPEEPTEILPRMNKDDSIFPPNPDNK